MTKKHVILLLLLLLLASSLPRFLASRFSFNFRFALLACLKEQSSWKANRFSVSQEIPRIL
jgi:hypothetical protein